MNCVEKGILGVWDGVVHKTDTPHHLPRLLHLVANIGRITVDLLTFGCLSTTFDTNHLSSLVDDLINGFVQHVGSSVDSRQACKALWQLAQPIEGVKVWRLSISCQRVTVELDSLQCLCARLFQVIVIPEQSQCVSHKVRGILIKPKFLVDLSHGGGLGVNILPGLGVLLAEVLDKDEEVLESSFLEEAHEVRGERLLLICRHL